MTNPPPTAEDATQGKQITWSIIWQKLTKPADTLQEIDARYQAQLLAKLLLALLLATTIGIVVFLSMPRLAIFLAVVWVILVIAYRLSRTQYYFIAAIITVLIVALAPFVSLIVRNDFSLLTFNGAFLWLTISFVMGSIFFPLRGMLILAATSISALLIFSLVIQDISLGPVVNVTAFATIISGLIIITINYRNQVEKERMSLLEKQAAEITQANQEMQSRAVELEAANKALERFAHITSHDLKSPLRAIANLVDWIAEDVGDALTGETQSYIDLLQGRVRRMEALINGILQYSLVGRTQSQIEMVDVYELISETIDILNPPEAMQIDIDPDMPIFVTESVKLQQVFANLIGNAIKYHDKQDGHIKVSVYDNEELYEFGVADDGPGIPPKYHRRIFEMFQTLQSRDEVESTGIGLAIVKRILEDQGNTIRVQSAEGEGTTFYFTWPKKAKRIMSVGDTPHTQPDL